VKKKVNRGAPVGRLLFECLKERNLMGRKKGKLGFGNGLLKEKKSNTQIYSHTQGKQKTKKKI
jgi:hypothetical protein